MILSLNLVLSLPLSTLLITHTHRGNAKAMKIEAEACAVKMKIDAESQATATLVKARADGEAETLRAEGSKKAAVLRAEGSKQAAVLLETSKVAVTLETLKTSAGAIKESDKFFFGQEPSYMPNVFVRTNETSKGSEAGDAANEYDEFAGITRGTSGHMLT